MKHQEGGTGGAAPAAAPTGPAVDHAIIQQRQQLPASTLTLGDKANTEILFGLFLLFEIILHFLGFFFGFCFFLNILGVFLYILVFKNYKTDFAMARGCIALYPFSFETFLSCSTLYNSRISSISCFVSGSVTVISLINVEGVQKLPNH